MNWLLLGCFLALTPVLCLQREPENAPMAINEFDLSIVGLRPVAQDASNLFFELTVRNHTDAVISPREITIESMFSPVEELDLASPELTQAGRSGLGGVGPVPAGGERSRRKHVRLVDRFGNSRLNADHRFLHVRVLHQPPGISTAGVVADVATIDLMNLPPNLPERPPPSPRRQGSGRLIDWLWTLPLPLLFVVGERLSKLVGRLCHQKLPGGWRVLVGASLGGALCVACAISGLWLSPFGGDSFWFFARFIGTFWGFVGAVQGGSTAAGANSRWGIREADS
ncbi:hypothetical protein NG895_03145 [Aeoliella sp. ICT_H6.2]|uniref:Uncharacterized protein n=1 Tax=Aeoliella straminimaris TaxID=2954799 RepID=A0A9X2JED8_9BACT|nr:hypothetical protein [Aeoliella straminimaris]MCO6042895.1 hypothetical protein [Aeoliella straminimaris]